ncbi:MAG: DUF4397 domain-containing protein [Chitinophagaceae bacterium]|nr:DUF4397 domain-containing protein [Chitinophagaceae bacterium]
MKLKNIILAGLLITGTSMMLWSCEKEKEIQAPWETAGSTSEKAHLRIIHASPNFRAVTGRPDSIHVFVNTAKVNGARMSFGSAFPATTPNSYIALPAGLSNIKISVGGLVNYDSIPITSITTTMDAGRYYSLVITDSIMNGSRDSAKMFMRDDVPNLFQGRTSFRFINCMVDTGATATQRVDVWSSRRNNYLYTNVATGTISSFSNQPFINLGDTLIVRRAGTTTEIARLNNIIFGDTRVYTMFLRGQVNVTGTKAKTLTWYTNR